MARRRQTASQAAAGPMDRLLGGAIVLCLGLQLISVFSREINWDEFFYLSHVYSFKAGTLLRALQTFHVHLFFWLPSTGGDEISQIEAGRIAMWFCQLGICLSIYLIARRFFGATHALMAVLAYAACGFVLDHGMSFRADPLAACLAMLLLSLLLLTRLSFVHIVLAALALALAMLVTIKTVFYAPALIAAGVWRISEAESRPWMMVRLAGCACLALIVFAVGYAAHLLALPRADHAGSEALVTSAAETTLGTLILFPRWLEFVRTLAISPGNWLLLLGGIWLAAKAVAEGHGRRRALLYLGLASPLLCLFVYRNAFPYFYAFILPPAAPLAAMTTQWLDKREKRLSAAALVVLFPAVAYWIAGLSWSQTKQEEIIDAVHRMFPQPVATIDRNAMLSSFPKKGPFMSTWGLKSYTENGKPVFDDILGEETVPLLILNSPSLEDAVGAPLSSRLDYRLLPQDRAVLRENYIPWWGAVWVAGKRFDLRRECVTMSIRIPGRYTLASGASVRIGSLEYTNGQEVLLARGDHELCTDRPQAIALRWGRADLYRPETPLSSGPVYRGFR